MCVSALRLVLIRSKQEIPAAQLEELTTLLFCFALYFALLFHFVFSFAVFLFCSAPVGNSVAGRVCALRRAQLRALFRLPWAAAERRHVLAAAPGEQQGQLSNAKGKGSSSRG